MSNRERTSRVIISLIASMTLGALVLMALDNHSITAGAFSLASYTNLSPVEKIASASLSSKVRQWDYIEVYYSGTISGSIDQLAKFSGLASSKDVNFHFLVCNGTGCQDGKIQATARWNGQTAAVPAANWTGPSRTIRICVIADGVRALATDTQIQRTTDMAESLARDFNIPKDNISYPPSWQL